MMAKRLVSNLICNSNSLKLKAFFPVLHKELHTKVPTKEIQIPVQYGHIAAKLWGSSENRPILALHGWQDNAGTWDPIVPMLLKDRPILAIDFPGHGLSSWLPPGAMYYQWELPRVILFLKRYFQWDKVSLLCHSMGAIAGMRYACLYPDDVDFFIALDSLMYDAYDLNQIINQYAKLIEKGLNALTQLNEEPPLYTIEEMKNIWHRGTNKSVALESVKFLLERGAKQSKQDPTKYYFSRDSRLKYGLFNPEDKHFVEQQVRRLKAPTLHVRATDSPYSAVDYSADMRDIIEKNNEKYELQYVPGTHHVHLNNPEKVTPLILIFLQKYNA